MKLTQREQTILKAMQDGERCIYMPYAGRFRPNAYYTLGKVGKCTREIKKMIKLGLVRHESTVFNKANIFLTHEGEAFKCELDEPYDIWVVNFENYGNKVEKYSGFLNGNTVTKANGGVFREGNDKKFFLNRDKAFEYVMELQKAVIRSKEDAVLAAKNLLNQLEEHRKNPEMDKSGYL